MSVSVVHDAFRPQVPVIDACVRVGDLRAQRSECQDVRHLRNELQRHGVQRAVVYHAHGEEVSSIDGNLLLRGWVDHQELLPLWSALPTDESLTQLAGLRAKGECRAVMLHLPVASGLPFRPYLCDSLLRWLSDAAIPLWLPLPDMDSDQVCSTLLEYPDLTTLLLGAHYDHALVVRPLLRRLAHCHLDVSRFEVLGGVADLVEEFGPERLVYSSWYPRYAMGPVLFGLHHNRLPPAHLRQICAGNVARLLGLPEAAG